MIASLRRAHRRAFFALALFVPAVLGWAAAVRRPLPAATVQPPDGAPARAGARRIGDEIELVSDLGQRFPDVLVYWSDDPNSVGAGARLVGRTLGDGVVPERFDLSSGMRLIERRYLHLYSLAHQELVGTFDLAAGDDGTEPR